MKSFDDALRQKNGIGPGFDFLRVFLSLSILFCHSFLIAEGERHQLSGPIRGVFRESLVPMFFALSGFLITASALRLRLKDFLLNRALRIVPALAVDICLSALFLGPIFTELPIAEYLRGAEFRSYFANILGMVFLYLPGVFEHNPFPRIVNLNLWTIPFEIGCYAIMSLLIITRLLKRPFLTAIFTAGVAILVAWTVHRHGELLSVGPPNESSAAFKVASRFIYKFGLTLYVCFMVGSLAYLYRRFIPFHGAIALVCVAAVSGAVAIFPALGVWETCALLSPLIVYVTIYVGLSNVPPLPIYKNGDYSYGIYLYGFPVQQALVVVFPGLVSPWLHFAISAFLVTAIAMGSWHFIEKPILSLRRKFSFTARKGETMAELPSLAAVQRVPGALS